MGSRDKEHEAWNLEHGLKPGATLALVCPRCARPHVETLTSDPNEPDYHHHVHQCTYCDLRFELYVRCRSVAPPPPDEATVAYAVGNLLASCVRDGVLQMRDVDRASVYKEHLGGRLTGERTHHEFVGGRLEKGEPERSRCDVHFNIDLGPGDEKSIDGMFQYHLRGANRSEVFETPACQRAFRGHHFEDLPAGLLITGLRIGPREQLDGLDVQIPVGTKVLPLSLEDCLPGMVIAIRLKNTTKKAITGKAVLHGLQLI